MKKELLKGNVAIAEAAIRAGLDAYFGYPITPQTEILEWMSHRLPELGRAFVQAESEVAAINMVFGAACAGARVMTTSSSPGFSLMMEGLSYIAATEVPAVLVNVMRGGPGLGNLGPAQADYAQSVHGGGHGDIFPIVMAPATVQESIDLVMKAFDLAERYRSIVILLTDGSLGQMMEPAVLPEMQPVRQSVPDWAVGGSSGREPIVHIPFRFQSEDMEALNIRNLDRWQQVKQNEVDVRQYYMEDAEIVVTGFGTTARVALSAVRMARAEGIKVGLVRPVILNPFPTEIYTQVAGVARSLLVVETNAGQMYRDVQMAVSGRIPVEFYGRLGGVMPFADEILGEIRRMAGGEIIESGEDPLQRWLARLKVQRA